MHWKLARDRYLGPLAARLGEAVATDAGFFFDADDRDAPLDDVDWLCTPIPRASAAAAARPVALVSTGGFCPVHDGHLAMMDRARDAAIAAGHDVIAGYLSPDHDAYVRGKCGAAAIPASERLRACAAAIGDRDWLFVDPWQALYRRGAINYTDVVARLRTYLRARVDPRIDVLYVCGGDNARFAQAFVDDGGCIVVDRPGTAAFADVRARLACHARLIWCDGDHPGASRAIRGGAWRDLAGRRVVMRVEDDRAVRTLGLAGFAAFQRELAALLADHVGVREVPVGEPVAAPGAISLDAMQPAAHQLALSRLYALGGYHTSGHVARPGTPPLADQLAAIPPGDYALCDDDSMTGGTLAAVRAMLPASVRVTQIRLAIEHAADEDVIDSRDFLLGADDAGLVVALPGGGIGRAPYVLPYVDPAARCSIPPLHIARFSIAVWRLNARVFEATGHRVRDLPAPTRATFRELGDRTLADVCGWHADRLADQSL